MRPKCSDCWRWSGLKRRCWRCKLLRFAIAVDVDRLQNQTWRVTEDVFLYGDAYLDHTGQHLPREQVLAGTRPTWVIGFDAKRRPYTDADAPRPPAEPRGILGDPANPIVDVVRDGAGRAVCTCAPDHVCSLHSLAPPHRDPKRTPPNPFPHP